MSPSIKNSLNTLINPRLGELEKKILGIASGLGEFTLRELCEKLEQREIVSKGSVYHAVSRLTEKGLLERVKKGVFRYAGDRFTTSAEDRFRIQSRSIQDHMTDRFRITSEKQRAIDSGSHADRFRIPHGEVRDKTTGEPRGLGKDNSAGDSRGIVLASSIEEPCGSGKDKSISEQFTKPLEDRLGIPSREANDEFSGEQFTKTISGREIDVKTQTAETKPPTSITTTKGEKAPAEGDKQTPVVSSQEIVPAYGGVAPSLAGTGGLGFAVHRFVLGFGFGVLPHVVLSVFPSGSCRRVEVSGQLVCRDVVGGGRVVTFEFNVKSSGGLVFLEASENPLSVGEFLGFVDWYLLHVFRRLTGREVSRSEFAVKAAPHLNTDLPGVYLEGVKSVTLQDYYDEAVRAYLKKINGETYTRVEVEAKSWVNSNLEDVANGLVTFAKLPVIASRLEKVSAKLEEIAEGGISGRAIAAAVKTDLANLIYAFYLKVADVLINQFAPVLAPEIGKAVKESIAETLREMEAVRREHGKLLTEFRKLSERVERLARENAELKRKLEEYELAQKQVKFDDLHEEIRQLLKKLEESGLVRAKHERVEYGYAVWKAVHDYRGNLDYWLEEKLAEAIPEVVADYRLRRAVSAAVKAIVHYDNRYGDKPGVPYSLWLKKFEEYLKPLTLEQGLRAISEHVAKTSKKAGEDESVLDVLDILRKRIGEKTGKQGK